MRFLTKLERETIVVYNDAEENATVTTSMRRIITKLKKNPSAEIIFEIADPHTVQFSLPKEYVSYRRKRKTVS